MKTNSNIGVTYALLGAFLVYFSFTVLFLGPLQAFSYQPGYVSDPNELKILGGLLFVLAVSLILPIDKRAPESVFLWLIFLIMVIPRFVVAGCRDLPLTYIAFTAFAFLSVVGIEKIIKVHSVPRLFKSNKVLNRVRDLAIGIACGVMLLLTVYLLLFEGFPGFDAFNADLVYEIRAEATASTWISTLLSLLSSFIGPLLLIYCFVTKRIGQAVLVSCWLVFAFLYVAMKTWLLVLILLWILFLFHKFGKLNTKSIIGLFSLFFVLLTIMYIFVPENNEVLFNVFSVFYRRLIMVPAILGYAYFDFFATNPPILLQNTVFSFLTPMPREYSVVDYQNLIGFSALGSAESWANTGLFGSEYAQFGLLSVFIIIINLSFLLYLIKSKGDAKVKEFLLYSAVLIPFLLLNVSSVRFLFSYSGLVGIVFFVILLASFRENRESVEEWKKFD